MAHNEWILDVLSDLKTFAAANGMSTLAEQLDDTRLVAAVEIASQKEEAHALADGGQGQIRTGFGGLGRCQRA